MTRTYVSQPQQINKTEVYDDSLVTGPGLQTGSTNLQVDLNALRTQIRQLLWANVSGSWYDAISAPSGSNSARGLNTINNDLTNLEQKRFLFRRQNLNLLHVATGSNFALLSVSLGTAPDNFAAVSGNTTGSIVFSLSPGSYGSFNTGSISGSNVLSPKNLVLVRDAWSGLILTASSGVDLGRDIFGLLQAENGVANGDSFNDSTKRTQLSFVVEKITNGTSSFSASMPSWIGGKTVQYSYVRRTALDEIPEDAYITDASFFDAPNAISGTALLADVTLQRAIDNQVTIVNQNNDISIRLNTGTSWTFMSGTQELWKLASSNQSDTLTVNVDRVAFSSSFETTFTRGVSVGTGSTQINVGVAPGVINTLTGNNLTVQGGNLVQFSDGNSIFSNYSGSLPVASGVLEWNNFSQNYGSSTTILGAFNTVSQSLNTLSGSITSLSTSTSQSIASLSQSLTSLSQSLTSLSQSVVLLSQSVSSSIRRTRVSVGVNQLIMAGTNVIFPTNVDAPLLSYAGKDFETDLNVYLNGILLYPGRSGSAGNDVYPGVSSTTGDLKFNMKIKSGSIISVERF